MPKENFQSPKFNSNLRLEQPALSHSPKNITRVWIDSRQVLFNIDTRQYGQCWDIDREIHWNASNTFA